MNVDELKVAAAYVNQGPTLKRFRARAMGRGNVIRKRTSHITLVLSEEVKK
jgi:large subunit ribosomal protein L22